MALGWLHFSVGYTRGGEVGLLQVETSALTHLLLENSAKFGDFPV